MLLCELPSKNDLDITDDPLWADDDIYDCSDFKFPDEEGPKDNSPVINVPLWMLRLEEKS